MVSVSATGAPNLDEILGGGLPDRTLTLLVGVPGAGKTILATQIAMHHARQGQRVLIFTALSESHDQMLADLAGFAFADPTLIGDSLRFYSVQSVLEQGLPAVSALIVETTRREHAAFVVLDGFHGITGFAHDDREINRFLHTLRAQLALLDVTVLVTYETDVSQRHRSGTLTIADGILALHNVLEGERDRRWLQVVKLRGMAHYGGLHTLTITGEGITCYPRQEAAYRSVSSPASRERAAIGLPELDAMLGGGLNRNTATFLAGSPGTGKTLTALHFLMTGANAGEPGMFVGLAESAAQLFLKAQTFGLDLEGAVARGTVSLLTRSSAAVDVDILATTIREHVMQRGICRLVIDTIAVVEAAIPFPDRGPRYMASLLDYLREHGVTSMLTQESNAFGGGQLGEELAAMLSDNLILLRWVQYANQSVRILSVRKMRHSAFDTAVREYHIEGGAIHVLPVAESAAGVLTGITAQEQREEHRTRENGRG